MNKLSIHRALSKLKLLDARIKKQTAVINPTGIHQKERKVALKYTLEEFAEKAKSDLDSTLALIAEKNRLKCKIVESNAATKVTVGGKEMTVAEAINFKTLIEYKKGVVAVLKANLSKSKADAEKNNSLVEANCQKIIEGAAGKDSVKVDKDFINQIKEPFMKQNEWHLFDPLNVEKIIKELEIEIDSFEADVDAVLSESNATTMIEM